MLLRFLEPSAGRVTLSGVDLRGLDGDTVRRVVGLLAQDAHIVDSAVWESVRLACPDATRDELRDALPAARLLDWVDWLPDGLDAPVGEHGGRMSGDQRHLGLAGVLLADFPVLVLEEPRPGNASDLARRPCSPTLLDDLARRRARGAPPCW